MWFSLQIAAVLGAVLALVYEAALTSPRSRSASASRRVIVAFYVVQGICVVTLTTRRASAISPAGDGRRLRRARSRFQEGNNAPVSRWLLGMGAVVIAGNAVSMLVERMR